MGFSKVTVIGRQQKRNLHDDTQGKCIGIIAEEQVLQIKHWQELGFLQGAKGGKVRYLWIGWLILLKLGSDQ